MAEYWQIAAGDEGRNYAASFLDHGMRSFSGETHVESICSLKASARLPLTHGSGAILAVGELVERDGRVSDDARDGEAGRQWLRDFDGRDLSGWPHVGWHNVPTDRQEAKGLTRSRFERHKVDSLKAKAGEFLATPPPRTDRRPGPDPADPVGEERFRPPLAERGLRASAGEEVTAKLLRICLLADGNDGPDDRSVFEENETRTFLIAPFLPALGWAERQFKIEFGRPSGSTEIARFRDPSRSVAACDCVTLIETKDRSQWLGHAAGFQACKFLLVSSGAYYGTYSRKVKHRFTPSPVARLGVRRPTRLARHRPTGPAEARPAA